MATNGNSKALRTVLSRAVGRTRSALLGSVLAVLTLTGVTAAVTLSSTAASGVTSHAKAPVKIGYVGTMSGPQASSAAGTENFFQALIAGTNARGGIYGHKIQLTVLDDQGNPAQSLLDFERLWTQDHVSAIFDNDFVIPLSYVKQNNIPVFACYPAQCFSSAYPSLIPTLGTTPGWADQVAYWLVRMRHEPIKTVAVVYFGFQAQYNGFIKSFWQKLGATNVLFYPDTGPVADCTPYVLKWKSEGVQFIDFESSNFVPCVEAEGIQNWFPQYSQGGALTSGSGLPALVGKPIIGTVAGMATTASNGSPIFSKAQPIDRQLVGDIKRFAPSFATPYYLGNTTLLAYAEGLPMVSMLQGTMKKYGRVTPNLLLKYAHAVKYLDNGLAPPMVGNSVTCKTAQDGTTWGFWHANPKGNPPYTHFPQVSGKKWITSNWLGMGKCYQTKLANQFYPNG